MALPRPHHYDIYREELGKAYPGFGTALWNPSPEDSPPVEVGDVGFIRAGKFHRIFTALENGEHPSNRNSLGVPERYEPLRLARGLIHSGSYAGPTEGPTIFKTLGVSAVTVAAAVSGGSEGTVAGSTPTNAASASYTCTKKRGAVLTLPKIARYKETLALAHFRKWITTHITSLFALSVRLGLEIKEEEIILVTGWHRTESWSNITFFDFRSNARLSLGFGVAGIVGASADLQTSDDRITGAVHNQGPSGEVNQGPRGENLLESARECVFIKKVHVKFTDKSLAKLRSIFRTRAGDEPGPNPQAAPEPKPDPQATTEPKPDSQATAEPKSDPPEDDREPEMEALPISEYRDPLHVLLEYIAKLAPNCDVALVHDDDLDRILRAGDSSLLETLQPDVMMGYLEKLEPEIVYESHPLPAGDGTPRIETEHITVAMLSAEFKSLTTTDHPSSVPLPSHLSVSTTKREESVRDNAPSYPPEPAPPGAFPELADVNAQEVDHSTPLHLASSKGNVEAAQLLPEGGADVDARDKNLSAPLHLASPGGQVETMRLLILRRADRNARDKDYSTPLHLASSEGNVEAAQLLLEGGADVDARDKNLSAPLHLASSGGQVETMRLLIQHGADRNARDKYHSTPLHLASSTGNVEAAQLLLEGGADVDARDKNDSTPLHCAFSLGQVETMRLLIQHGADPDAREKDPSTPLHRASSTGNVEAAQLLLEGGADVDARDENHSTPLLLASSAGSAMTVRLLIEHGADVFAQSEFHSTALHLASYVGSVDTVRLLIDHGADLDAQNMRRSTPLHLASSRGQVETMRLLIQRGADRNARDKDHSTPLHRASSTGNVEAAQLLLEGGADVDARDNNHSTPLLLASSAGSAMTVRLLIEHGADVFVQNDYHSTALHRASSAGSVDTVRLLIDHGADLDTQNMRRSTPLHLASSAGSGETVKLLIERGADVNVEDEDGQTPFRLAASAPGKHPGTNAVAKLLWSEINKM